MYARPFVSAMQLSFAWMHPLLFLLNPDRDNPWNRQLNASFQRTARKVWSALSLQQTQGLMHCFTFIPRLGRSGPQEIMFHGNCLIKPGRTWPLTLLILLNANHTSSIFHVKKEPDPNPRIKRNQTSASGSIFPAGKGQRLPG